MTITYNTDELFRLKPGWRWPHFKPTEFVSKGDRPKRLEIDELLLDKLELLRFNVNQPIIINSGYRSPHYNDKVSTTGLTGPHTTGLAVDIKCLDSLLRFKIVKHAIELQFTGIGIADTFVHLDLIEGDPSIPRPRLWLY